MNTSYLLKVNDKAEFDSATLLQKKIDAKEVQQNVFHALLDNQSFHAEIITAEFNSKTYQISVNGNNYEVKIQTPLDTLINELGFSLNTQKLVDSLIAPMPGLILDINVTVGQKVNENDNLLILEAMKMENNLTSPRSGVIKAISVSKGDTVDKSQVLIEFE